MVFAQPGAAWWQQHGHRAGCTGAGYTRCYGSTGVLSCWKLAQIPWWAAASALHSNLHISVSFLQSSRPPTQRAYENNTFHEAFSTLWEKWENKMRSLARCSAPTRPQGGETEGHFVPIFCKPKCFLERFATFLWLRGLFAYRNTPEQNTVVTNEVCGRSPHITICPLAFQWAKSHPPPFPNPRASSLWYQELAKGDKESWRVLRKRTSWECSHSWDLLLRWTPAAPTSSATCQHKHRASAERRGAEHTSWATQLHVGGQHSLWLRAAASKLRLRVSSVLSIFSSS